MKKVIIIGEPTIEQTQIIEKMVKKHPEIEIVAVDQTESPFGRAPLEFLPRPLFPIKAIYYKNGKPFDPPTSKFHK